jgi:metal-dependent amidase/aminoacylase/carboxypeptidase family protein
MAGHIAKAHRATATTFIEHHYPVTCNHAGATDFLFQVAGRKLRAGQLQALELPSMAAEDFSYYLKEIPGCFCFLGVDRPSDDNFPLHHPSFNFNDEALQTGIEFFVALVSSLNELPPSFLPKE